MSGDDFNSDAFNEVGDAVIASVMQYVDERHARTGEPREVLCLQAGKSLTVLGFTFIGNVLQLDAATAIDAAEEAIKRLGAIAVERKKGG